MKQFAGLLIGLSLISSGAGDNRAAADDFRVLPFLQNPSQEGITMRWLSESSQPGVLTVETPEGTQSWNSEPLQPAALACNPFKSEPGEPHPGLPWLHTVRVTGLAAGTRFRYEVRQGTAKHQASFSTAPSIDQPVRLIAYADSETEPESSTSPPVDWPVSAGSNRPPEVTRYVVDQTAGYRANLEVIAARQPNLILIAGDLVETGGEQRDWDEFWRHNAGEYGNIASHVPLVAALGNHENYAGPGGGYTTDGANFATDKFLTYFDSPHNGASNPKHHGRYFRLDYGPVTLITLDSSDGLPDKTAADTNHNLSGSNAPDFNPGSEQYEWLKAQLADAQQKSRFTFVQFHHTMYGSGPHSIRFGQPGFSGQSGIAMRVLEPLFFRYGVDLVISGHDELFERSEVSGSETLPDGSSRPHIIHFYDVGVGGDGLRGPSEGFDNPFRRFLAHDDVPEVWEGGRLVSGGKHYGHLEINVAREDSGKWHVQIVPVHVFPILDDQGQVTRWDRRIYDDLVVIEQCSVISGMMDLSSVGRRYGEERSARELRGP